jgi:hypothetical protein
MEKRLLCLTKTLKNMETQHEFGTLPRNVLILPFHSKAVSAA